MALHTILEACSVKLLHHGDRNMKGNRKRKEKLTIHCP